MKVTQAMRDMAVKIGVPLDKLESDYWAQKYVKGCIEDTKPRTHRDLSEPSDASGYTEGFSIQVIRKR